MKRWVLFFRDEYGREVYFRSLDAGNAPIKSKDPMECPCWPTAQGAYRYATNVKSLQRWRVGHRLTNNTTQGFYREVA